MADPQIAGDVPPGEEELRAAYEAELARITSAEVILQTAVSLLNIAGRRLGIGGSGGSGEASGGTSSSGSDIEQVRDAIDGVRALMPVLERRAVAELGPLREALSQLQMAYARQVSPSEDRGSGQAPLKQAPSAEKRGPGPAETSGRLWVPGR